MRYFKVLGLGLLLLLMLVAGAGWYLLFTQGGRDVLVREVNGYTAKLATPVVLGRLEGSVFRDARLSGVTVADGRGVWLTAQGIRLVWQPRALWRGTPPFERLDVATVNVARLPVVVTPTAVVSGTVVNPLDYLVYVPRNLRLGDVVVEAPVVGRRYRLRAGIESAGRVQTVSVSTLEGPATTVSGTVTLVAVDDVAADLEVREAAKGLIGGLLKLPDTAEIAARVVGNFRQNMVRIDMLDARAGQSHVVASGRGTLDGRVVNGAVRVTSGNLAEWQKLSGLDLHGAVDAAVQVSGSLAQLGVGVQASRTDIAVGEIRVAGTTLAVSGTVDATKPDGRFKVNVDGRGTLSGVGKGAYPLVLVADATGTRAAFESHARAVMDRKSEHAEVKVSGAVVVSPMTLNGAVDGAWEQLIQGKTNRFVAQGHVDVDPTRAVLNGMRVTGPGVEVSASGTVDLGKLLVNGGAVVRVKDFAPLAALAGVQVKGGMDADVTARTADGKQVADATVRRFAVEYGDYKALLKQPARLVWDGVRGSLSPFNLDVAGGTVTAQGTLSEQAVDAKLTVTGVDVKELTGSDVVTGRVAMAATATGRPAAPVVVVTGDFKGTTGDYPIDATLHGDWRGERLALTAVGSSREASTTADVVVGGGLSLIPFKLGVGTASSMRGSVSANVPLTIFNTLLWASRQQLGGSLSGHANLAGTLGMPDVKGTFALRDGAYTHSTSGVCLQNVAADIVGSRDQILVTNLSAHDAGGGTLSGKAQLGLSGDQPLSAEIALGHLKLFCGGPATGVIDGTLAAQGTLADHLLRGALTLGPLNVQLPGSNGNTDIPQVETQRVKTGGTALAGPGMVTRLAVSIDAPKEIYVRGRGMDAEFGGKIDVAGTADAPLLSGTLKALRGRYTLLDRVLQLADSTVRFDGPIPPSPYLDVKATTTAQSTAITLNITGTATKPTLALTTDPSVPQDEALALLLFGRSLSNISAFEALKLAQATRVLAGLDGGGPSILDKARKTLGVDTLDIGSSGDSDVTVTTGKYLTDNIYLSVQQGSEPTDREVKTEVELTPSVSGNTTVDGVGNQSFGLEWKRDY